VDESLCRYQIPSVCTSREVTVVTGRIVCGYQNTYDALQASSQSYWTQVYVGVNTLLYALLGKTQSLLNGILNDLQSCGISSDAAVFIVGEPGESKCFNLFENL